MELLIPERFTLLDILPKEGDYVTLGEVHRLRIELSPDAEEIERFKIKSEEGRIEVTPDPEIVKELQTYTKDCLINSWGVAKIQDLLRDMNTKQKLTMREMSLYEKFIVAYDQV